MNDLFVPGKKGLVGRDKIRELAPRYWLCTDQGSLAEIGFRPRYSLKEGMAATIEWYRKNDLLA
jgi:nucleoside-diphosphate-sugar epimerase